MRGRSISQRSLFVGREREAKRIEAELARGRHVVVTGPYGIGRTSLVRWLSESERLRNRYRFIFVDFERSAAEMERLLFHELFPLRARRDPPESLPSSGVRFRITEVRPEDARRQVLVFDNVTRLSRSKLALLDALALSKRYAIVAIVEDFVPASNLEKLRTRLAPAPLVTLGRLSQKTARRYFALASERYRLGWSADGIAGVAAATRGYPLAMWEAVAGGRKRLTASSRSESFS